MKVAVVVMIVLVACSGHKEAAPPDPAAFRAMTPDQQCEATAARGALCADALVVDDIHSMSGGDPGMDELGQAVEKDIQRDPIAPDAARRIHHTRCLASDAYAAAVVECWTVTDCKQFARCVGDVEKRESRRRR